MRYKHDFVDEFAIADDFNDERKLEELENETV